MWYNPLITYILLSPLHGFISRSILLLTYTGYKTGKQYTTPLSYVPDADNILIVSLRRRTWWKNFLNEAPVTVRVKGRDLPARARAITEPPNEVQAALCIYLKSQRDLARILKVRFDSDGNPDPETLAKAAENRVMVRVRLNPV
jgi:deazaflavin-dependent oxidoreductase (nitroreductase family)